MMEELGVALVPFERMVYVEDRAQFMPEDAVPAGARSSTVAKAYRGLS